jgi:type II secretory pathway component GspD/PulD (secretin)
MPLFSARWKLALFTALVVSVHVFYETSAVAQEAGRTKRVERRSATIHWQRVPLRDAVGRLRALFDEPVFVDRRVDPNVRVSLDIEAASIEEVIGALAAETDLSGDRVGGVVYLGPKGAAEQLRAVTAARTQDVARLAPALRNSLRKKEKMDWPRLTEPRQIIATAAERRGWQMVNAELVPHDLWSAGQLPEMAFADQLSLLLIGFDLTFELRPTDQAIEIVRLKADARAPAPGATAAKPQVSPPAGSKRSSRQVYTLRVQEQPVRAILQQLSERLHWAIQIDEEAIRAAGKSLDTRVSFSVENANQEKLLEAVLKPAGLDFRLEDDRVRILPRRYD